MMKSSTYSGKGLVSTVKDLATFVPFLAAYFILYGGISLFKYYSEFNISIESFISFSEIVIYFMKDILAVLSSVGLVLAMGATLHLFDKQAAKVKDDLEAGISTTEAQLPDSRKQVKELDQLIDKIENASNKSEKKEAIKLARPLLQKVMQSEDGLRSAIKTHRITIRLIGAVFVLSATLLVMLVVYGALMDAHRAIGHLFVLTACLVILHFTKSLFYYLLTYSVLSLLVGAYIQAGQAAEKVRNGKGQRVELVLSGEQNRIDASCVYVGKTNEYIFFYDTLDTHIEIIPTENIVHLKILGPLVGADL